MDVEENGETVYLDVLRTRGSLDRISVDVVTTPITASSIAGSAMYLSTIQQVGAYT